MMRTRQTASSAPSIGVYSSLDYRRRKEAAAQVDRSLYARVYAMGAMLATLFFFIVASIFLEEGSSSGDTAYVAESEADLSTWRQAVAKGVGLPEVRWAIIGCGAVTEVKSGPGLALAEGSRLVHVMRRNLTAAKDYARRHKVAQWSDDAAKVISDSSVDAIYIATPPRYHLEYALRTAIAGKPAYVEKPAGRSRVETEEMVRAFRKAEVPLFFAYYRRALPNFQKVKSLLDSGKIGKVKAVRVQLYRPANKEDKKWQALGKTSSLAEGDSLKIASLASAWRTDPLVGGSGGYLRDKGSHQFDLLDYFFGPIVELSGIAENMANLYPAPDKASADFKFASGVVGSGVWCFVCDSEPELERSKDKKKSSSIPWKIKGEYIEVEGSSGFIRFQVFLSATIEMWINGQQEIIEDLVAPRHVQQPMIQAIVDTLRGKTRKGDRALDLKALNGSEAMVDGIRSKPLWMTTGESAIRTSHIIDSIVAGEKWRGIPLTSSERCKNLWCFINFFW